MALCSSSAVGNVAVLVSIFLVLSASFTDNPLQICAKVTHVYVQRLFRFLQFAVLLTSFSYNPLYLKYLVSPHALKPTFPYDATGDFCFALM